MGRTIYSLFVILLLIINCFLSCSDKGDKNLEEKFKRSKELNHEVVTIKDNEIYSKIYKLLINKNHLIAYDYNGEYFFSLTDINSDDIIARFGKKGQGPNEILMMPQTLTLIGDILYFYDLNQKSLFSINCSNGSNYIPQKIIDFDKNKKIMSVLPIADKKYVALGGFDNGRYLLLDENGHEISCYFDYPNFEGDELFTNLHKALAFQGSIMRRPDGKRFFFAAQDSELFEIIEMNEIDKLNKVFSFQGEIAKFGKEGDGINTAGAPKKKESKMFFIDANCTQNYIYLLYSNKVIGNNLFNAFRSNKILVFDWNGKPVTSLHLDIEVSYIAIDENDKNLYAYDQENEHLVKFKLI